MYKWKWKVFSMITILALALAMSPPVAVSALPGDGTINGHIAMAQPQNNPGAGFNVDAYPVGGGDGYCKGPVSYNIAGYYEYTLTGCDKDIDYTVVAQGSGYSFYEVSVTTFISGIATAPDITPVTRVVSGKVTKTDGTTGWGGFVLSYQLNGVPHTVTTNGSGDYTIPSVNDASTIYFPPIDMDGYDIPSDFSINPPLQANITNDFTSRGTRNIHGQIESVTGLKGCMADVTITVEAPGALTQTTKTEGDGGYHLNNLAPLNTYVVTPSKTNCVFTPASQAIDIRDGNGSQPIVFQIPSAGVWGNVKTTLGRDVSLAYYLIATYTTADGVSYSNSVNWANGGYWIQAPPSTGTLTISRVGGPAAFGYETAAASQPVTITDAWVQKDFTLTPSRTISGTMVGQGSTPVQKNATVDFGYGLKWTPSSPVTTYSIKAQPKLYYLSPLENGIISSTPLRFLANLTTAPAVTTANFTLNLRTYLLEGCLYDFNGNDALVLPAVRFRPATGYGTTLYPAALTADGCGPNRYYYKVTLPKGLAGALEADGHILRGVQIDGMNWNDWREFSATGNRAITGRIYSPNMNLDISGDFSGNGMLVLRDAATNDLVQTEGDLQGSYEFTIPMLESKAYTLSINPDQIPNGYNAQLFPMSPIVTANLAAADVDIPAASGFVLVHKPIDPASATGRGYFQATGPTQTVSWAYPPTNDQDRVRGFDVQVGTATTPFTDTSPAPVFYDGDPAAYEFTGLTNGLLYRFRVRTVYETDKGPWLETTPVPTAPANNSGYLPGTAAGLVTFTWNAVAPENYSGAALKYVVQYSTSSTFPATTATVTLSAVTTLTRDTLVAPAIRTTYYWRVKVQNSATPAVDISGWSPTQTFFNRYSNINPGPTYLEDNFGWDTNPVRFFAASANPTLPPNAYYQVELHRASPSEYYYWTFTKTANLTIPSARQFPDRLPNGTYDWQIGIVYGNDASAPLITDWTPGTGTITVP